MTVGPFPGDGAGLTTSDGRSVGPAANKSVPRCRSKVRTIFVITRGRVTGGP